MEKSIEQPNTLKIDGATVEFIEKLTWGMQEKIRQTLYGALKMQNMSMSNPSSARVEFSPEAVTNSRYKAIEICIKKITADDGTEIKYSEDWLNNLSVEDGDAIYARANAIANPEKK